VFCVSAAVADAAAECDLPHHLVLGSQLTFSVTVLQASDLPADCTDVFCQFKSVLILNYSITHSVLRLGYTLSHFDACHVTATSKDGDTPSVICDLVNRL